MTAVWQQVPATCHTSMLPILCCWEQSSKCLKAMRRSHKYSFYSFWYMGSSQVWLKCNCGLLGCSWVPGCDSTTHPCNRSSGEIELILFPFKSPPQCYFFCVGSCAEAQPEQSEWPAQCAVDLSAGRVTNVRAPSVALSTASVQVPCRTFCISLATHWSCTCHMWGCSSWPVFMVALWFTSGHQCYTSAVLEADPVWCAMFLNEALSLPAYRSSF